MAREREEKGSGDQVKNWTKKVTKRPDQTYNIKISINPNRNPCLGSTTKSFEITTVLYRISSTDHGCMIKMCKVSPSRPVS